MRSAHAHYALVDVYARHLLGLLIGGLHSFGRRGKFGDESLAHPGRLHHAVSEITQRALVQVGRQHAGVRAANVQHNDRVVLFLAHR